MLLMGVRTCVPLKTVKNLRQRTVGQARSCTCCGWRSSSPPSSSYSPPSSNATLLFSGPYKYLEIIGITSGVDFAEKNCKDSCKFLTPRGSLTGFVAILGMTTIIPLIVVVTIVVKEKTEAYTELLTPSISFTTKASLSSAASGLVVAALLAMLLVFVMQLILVLALTINIYGFSRKIFHLPAYKRIL